MKVFKISIFEGELQYWRRFGFISLQPLYLFSLYLLFLHLYSLYFYVFSLIYLIVQAYCILEKEQVRAL